MCISDVIMRRFLPTKNQYSLRSLVSTKLQHWHLRLLHLPLRTHRAPRRWLWHWIRRTPRNTSKLHVSQTTVHVIAEGTGTRCTCNSASIFCVNGSKDHDNLESVARGFDASIRQHRIQERVVVEERHQSAHVKLCVEEKFPVHTIPRCSSDQIHHHPPIHARVS